MNNIDNQIHAANAELLKEVDRQITVALGMLVVGHTHEAKIQLATIHVGLSIILNAINGTHMPHAEIDTLLQEMTQQATEACKHGGTT